MAVLVRLTWVMTWNCHPQLGALCYLLEFCHCCSCLLPTRSLPVGQRLWQSPWCIVGQSLLTDSCHVGDYPRHSFWSHPTPCMIDRDCSGELWGYRFYSKQPCCDKWSVTAKIWETNYKRFHWIGSKIGLEVLQFERYFNSFLYHSAWTVVRDPLFIKTAWNVAQ